LVENSKEEAISTEKNGGIGLQNVRRRLELLYPGKYNLNIQNGANVYSVHLKLKV
jgi:two-component system, LytTR family, sensor kinase